MKRLILGVLMAIIIVSSVALAEIQDDKVQDKINEKKIKDPKESIDVIITLKDIATDANIDKVIKKVGNIKINAKGWDEVYPNGFAATVTRKQMEILKEDSMVERVDIDEIQTIMLDTANNWSGATKARSASPTGFGVDGDRNGNKHNYANTDVVIAILDTGIDPKHKDLTGEDNGGTKKIIAWKDVIGGSVTPYDDQGHGSHVASIAAGDGSADPKYKGVAPGAALVGVKVCTSGGSCSMSNVITGINWVVANRVTYGIKIMSLSLGGIGASDGTDPESKALNNAVDKGIAVTVAAGNSGPIKYTIGSPGAAAKVITVGAMADPGYITGTLKTGLVDNGFYIAPFSSRGPTSDNKVKPDIVAPGVKIMAADNTYPNTATYHGGYLEMSGTSMSTPFTAGVLALMLDANYTRTPAQLKNIIRSTGEDYGTTGCDIDYGCGRLRAYRAVRMAKTGINDGTGDQAVPRHDRYVGYINDSTASKSYSVTITSTGYPYASTLIMTDWSGLVPYWYTAYGLTDAAIDLDLYAKNPSGTTVGSAEGIYRQETVVVRPSTTGTYKSIVDNFLGGGYYTLDISYK